MMQKAPVIVGMAIVVALLSLCLPAWSDQKVAQDERYAAMERGPHLGSISDALVGVEVVNTPTEGGTRIVRHGNGLLLRCDGFVLVPTPLIALTRSGKSSYADNQTVTVILHPGTEQERRLRGRHPRWLPPGMPYAVLKLIDFHGPALRTLLPGTLHAGDSLQVVWSAWDETTHRFLPLAHRTIPLADPDVTESADRGSSAETRPRRSGQGIERSRLRFATALEGVPAGAVVLGPETMAVGILPGEGVLARADRFLSFAGLSMATNCVSAMPIPAAPPQESAPNAASEGAEGGEMVRVPGGPVLLPRLALSEQPDMENDPVACVAPFEIDRYEVTNGEYLAFWRSLPEQERQDPQIYLALYPGGWSSGDPPFPAGLDRVPVLGVSLAGAQAYARWKGKRLPTPYEWCRAAFGPRGESAPPDWVKTYIADRQATWNQVLNQHRQYLRAYPAVVNAEAKVTAPDGTLQIGTVGPIPWLVSFEQSMAASQFSRDVVDGAADHIAGDWIEPTNVLAVGSRPYDRSPYGAMDMILNADETILPNPGGPVFGEQRYLQMNWTVPNHFDNNGLYPVVPGLATVIPYRLKRIVKSTSTSRLPGSTQADLFPGPPSLLWPYSSIPLSRLYRRVEIITNDVRLDKRLPMVTLAALAHLQEAIQMTYPITGWTLISTGERVITTDLGPISDSPPFAVPGFRVWRGMPRYYRVELGRAPALTDDGRPMGGDPGIAHRFSRSFDLWYVAPVGFRCAR